MRVPAQKRRVSRPGVALPALILGLVLVATTSLADTIHLKNGRVIHSSEVRVEGDVVEFRQYGGWVAVPRSIVDRIEENERTSPIAAAAETPQAGPSEGSAATAEGQEATEGEEGAGGQQGAEGEEGAASGQEGQEGPQDDQPPPEETRSYWRDRLEPLFDQMDRIESDLERYRPLATTSPAAAARVEELEEDLSAVEGQVEAIREEARRLGVPPGWVRR